MNVLANPIHFERGSQAAEETVGHSPVGNVLSSKEKT